jgi:hypothetical protein
MVYMVTFTINIPPMLAYIPYHTWILWVMIEVHIFFATPNFPQRPHSKSFLVMLLLGWSLPISQHGWSPSFFEKSQFLDLKTNGKPVDSKHFSYSIPWIPLKNQWIQSSSHILNLMNPIPNLMNPIFGFATHYLGVKTFLMGLNLLGRLLIRTRN